LAEFCWWDLEVNMSLLLIGFQFEVHQINWLKIFRMRVAMNSIQAGEVAKISMQQPLFAGPICQQSGGK
jgi:hypothetical protein